jgi:hypothetical protein
MRLPVAAALALLVAGCAAAPTTVTSVADEGLRARTAPDCEVRSVGDGPSRLARLHCVGGTGVAETSLDGCAASSRDASWFTLYTQEGRLARGAATATVLRGDEAVATLGVAAEAEDGKETMLPAAPAYLLRLELSGWDGEWVEATVECPAG